MDFPLFARMAMEDLVFSAAGSTPCRRPGNLVVEIAPPGIVVLYQGYLPGTVPFLDVLFARDCLWHRHVHFQEDQKPDVIFLREPIDSARLVLPDPPNDIAGHPDIERAVACWQECKRKVSAWGLVSTRTVYGFPTRVRIMIGAVTTRWSFSPWGRTMARGRHGFPLARIGANISVQDGFGSLSVIPAKAGIHVTPCGIGRINDAGSDSRFRGNDGVTTDAAGFS